MPDLLPTSHNTIQSWVIDSYKQRKEQIKSASTLTTTATQTSTQTSTQLVKKKEDSLTSSLYRWKTKRAFEATSTEKKDQYEQYLQEEPINAATPDVEGNENNNGIIISYWRGVESKWPELARFAYDALSIPAMSTECERCFSSGKKTIETRWALNADSIEACECQGQWIRHRFA